MRRFRSILFTGILILSQIVGLGFVSYAAVISLPHETRTLPNGLKMILVKYPSPGVIAYRFAVRVGSRNEIEKGKTGFAHFFEHLMFRGTKNMSGEAIGDLYTKIGCENNAYTWFDITDYHGQVSTRHLGTVLRVEADRFRNLYFSEKALRDEAGAVLGEFNKNAADPDVIIEERLLETAFTRHPYAHSTMGTKEDVLNFPSRYADVWPFFRRYYRPSNTTIVLVGDLSFGKVATEIQRHFGSWKNGKIEDVVIPSEPDQTAPRAATITLDRPTQARARVAYKIPGFSTQTNDSAALALLSEIYFGPTSEFQKKFLFTDQLIDMLRAAPLETIDPYVWSIDLRFTAAGDSRRAEILAALDKEVLKIAEQGPDPALLQATQERMRNLAITSWFQSPEALAGRISWFTNLEGDLGVIDRWIDRIGGLTAADLSTFARAYLIPSRKTTIVLEGVDR